MFRRFVALAHGDPRRRRLRTRLITGHMPVAEHIAHRYSGRGEPRDDLQQIAALGLIKAVDRYQPCYGRGFLPYAIPTIRGEVQRHFRDATWSLHVPRRMKELHLQLATAGDELGERLGRSPRPSELAAHLGLTVDEVYQGLDASAAYHPKSLNRSVRPDRDDTSGEFDDFLGDVDERLDNAENAAVLQPALLALAERERRIVLLRFFENKTQSEIARAVGISQMHVSRLLSQSLAQLRGHLARSSVSTGEMGSAAGARGRPKS